MFLKNFARNGLRSTTTSSLLLSSSSSLPLRFVLPLRRSLFVRTEPTPNPDSLKFLPGLKVMEDGNVFEASSMREARASPLAAAILQVEGVRSVMFGDEFISVNKSKDADWTTIKPFIYAAIADFDASGAPIIDYKLLEVERAAAEQRAKANNNVDDDGGGSGDDGSSSETVRLIKHLIDTRIRPAVAADGGDIVFRSFDTDNGVVYVQLRGACSGCPSSSVTLKSGIERMLMHFVTEVNGVVQVEDEEFERLERRLSSTPKK